VDRLKATHGDQDADAFPNRCSRHGSPAACSLQYSTGNRLHETEALSPERTAAVFAGNRAAEGSEDHAFHDPGAKDRPALYLLDRGKRNERTGARAYLLDLYGQADSTIIGDRSLGNDPELVGILGIRYLQGARQAGVIPVIKHFPGHGSSTVDSHGRLPVVDLSEDMLMERDFKPFRMAIEAGAEALMTAHILFTQIDAEYPATLSSRILRELLRERFGFQGVIVSDGMAMGALSKNFSVSESLKLMIEAGLDLILVHSRYDLVELKLEILKLLHQGMISEEQIDEGVERILRLKLRYGLVR